MLRSLLKTATVACKLGRGFGLCRGYEYSSGLHPSKDVSSLFEVSQLLKNIQNERQDVRENKDLYCWIVHLANDQIARNFYMGSPETGLYDSDQDNSLLNVLKHTVNSEFLDYKDLYHVTALVSNLIPHIPEAWALLTARLKADLKERSSPASSKPNLVYLYKAVGLYIARRKDQDYELISAFEAFMEREYNKLGAVARMEIIEAVAADISLLNSFSKYFIRAIEEIPTEIKNLSLAELGRLLELASVYANADMIIPQLPSFERKFLDLRAEIMHPSILAQFIVGFGRLKYQGDAFWDFVTNLIFTNFGYLDSLEDRLQVLRAYASVRRGSDEFWRYCVTTILKEENTRLFERDIGLYRILAEADVHINFEDEGLAQLDQIVDALVEKEDIFLGSQSKEDLAYIAGMTGDLEAGLKVNLAKLALRQKEHVDPRHQFYIDQFLESLKTVPEVKSFINGQNIEVITLRGEPLSDNKLQMKNEAEEEKESSETDNSEKKKSPNKTNKDSETKQFTQKSSQSSEYQSREEERGRRKYPSKPRN